MKHVFKLSLKYFVTRADINIISSDVSYVTAARTT